MFSRQLDRSKSRTQQQGRRNRKAWLSQTVQQKRTRTRVAAFEQLEGRVLLNGDRPDLADDVVRYRLAVTDTANQPLPTSSDGSALIAAGQTLRLHAYSQDVRKSITAIPTGSAVDGDPQGVFANFMDIFYTNADLMSLRYGETQQMVFTQQNTNAGITGTFTLTFQGETTAPISYYPADGTYDPENPPDPGAYLASGMQTALENLSNIGQGNVQVTVPPSTSQTFRVRFVNAMGERDVPLMTGNISGLTNCTSVDVTERFPANSTNAGTVWSSFTATSPFIHGMRAATETLEGGQPAGGQSYGPIGNFLGEGSSQAGFNSPGKRTEYEFFYVDFKVLNVGTVEISGNSAEGSGTETLVFPQNVTEDGIVTGGKIGFYQDIAHPLVLNIVPADIYVDSNWSSISAGADPDAAGPAKAMGNDAFLSLAAAQTANAVGAGTVVHVAVHGTAGSDNWSFRSQVSGNANFHTISFGGTTYQVPIGAELDLTVDLTGTVAGAPLAGGEGEGASDTADIVDDTGGVVANLRPGGGTVDGLGYSLDLTLLVNINVAANAGGEAHLTDSAGYDSFVSGPTYGYFAGPGFANYVVGFSPVTVTSTLGGDEAFLFDSAGDDTFTNYPAYGQLTGTNYNYRAEGFRHVSAYATTGADKAYLYDGAGNDVYVGRPEYGYLAGATYSGNAQGFKEDTVYSTAGGQDQAFMFDSPGNDTFVGRPGHTTLSSTNYLHTLESVENAYLYASAGGIDQASLYDSLGTDIFVSRPTYGYINYGTGSNYAEGVSQVNTYSTSGGDDQAYMFDSSGVETYVGHPGTATLTGTGFVQNVSGYPHISMYATPGGSDTASLYDSAQNDTFVSYPNFGYLSGAGFTNFVQDFAQVNAYATAGGVDTAYLFDGAGNDTFTSHPGYASLTGTGFSDYVEGFEQVNAYATGGTNTANMYDSTAGDIFVGRYEYGYLTGTVNGNTYSDTANAFQQVNVYATAGGVDAAYLYDSQGNDSLYGRAKTWQLTMPGRVLFGDSFEQVSADGTAGGTNSLDVSSVDYLFSRTGTWA